MGYIALSCISEYAGSIELYKTNANKKETITTISVSTAFSIRKNLKSDIHHISLSTNKMSCLTKNKYSKKVLNLRMLIHGLYLETHLEVGLMIDWIRNDCMTIIITVDWSIQTDCNFIFILDFNSKHFKLS